LFYFFAFAALGRTSSPVSVSSLGVSGAVEGREVRIFERYVLHLPDLELHVKQHAADVAHSGVGSEAPLGHGARVIVRLDAAKLLVHFG
jgi:hypothetical protein